MGEVIVCGHSIGTFRWSGPNGDRTFCTTCQRVYLITPPPPPRIVHNGWPLDDGTELCA